MKFNFRTTHTPFTHPLIMMSSSRKAEFNPLDLTNKIISDISGQNLSGMDKVDKTLELMRTRLGTHYDLDNMNKLGYFIAPRLFNHGTREMTEFMAAFDPSY